MVDTQPTTQLREEAIDWPGCHEAVIRTYDFHRQIGAEVLDSVLERPVTKIRSLAEKAKLLASVACVIFAYKD